MRGFAMVDAASWASSSLVIPPRVHRGHAPCIGRTCCPLVCRDSYGRRSFVFRKSLHFGSWKNRSRNIVFSSSEGRSNITEEFDQLDSKENELIAMRKDIVEAKSGLKSIEKERDQLLEGLAVAETKQKEYVTTIMHDKELAIGELEAAKSLFHNKLQQSVEEKLALESKLVFAKADAVELAVKVEKFVEIAFQQATSHAIEDAMLRMSAAETSAADAAYHIEEQITNASEGTILSIVEQAKGAIEKALTVAEKASDHVRKAVPVFDSGDDAGDEITAIQTENIKLVGAVNDLESQTQLAKSEVDKLRLQFEQTSAQLKGFTLRAEDAEKTLHEFQKSSRERTAKEEEKIKSLLEKLKKDAAEGRRMASKAFEAELENINAAIEAARETASSKNKAQKRQVDGLQRSLRASEAASKMWRQRSEMVESMLRKRTTLNEANEDALYMVNGGRVDFLKEDDSQKLKLLTDGPRRDIPQWMARRIRTFLHKLPPRKTDLPEALQSINRTLELPKLDEVWSIAHEKPKQGDMLIEHVTEKEIIEKKRKALEHALERRTTQRTPEQINLEPGTGTGSGYEIVFQGFNWESWRRKWYTDMASKASDLSQSGITSIWLPPPTESVAPQGYMPSDLYNLNSAYGSVEDLKDCIKEMHSQNLLVLGDVVLNHRCAQKQSPNGIWNIYGGKLAWGPEAIVRDDPNFQGRGNPSSGDIFHAAPNVDHSQDFVRKDIKEWLNWLRNEIGFDGWRLDFVRGFSGTYVKEYIESSNPAFSIGEYWDSLAYEHGNLCYNQDAHRQRIINWINATGGTSSAFDVTTKGILHSALHNQYWRLIDPQGKPTGVLGWWASRAVTFLENHDTGSTQGHWLFPRDKLMQGYAYILTHPGTPVVFYDHFYDFGMRDPINELIEARRRGGVSCRSHVKIYHANNDGYVAQIGDMLVMKIGHFDWNPSKENQLEGSWHKFVHKGGDYQVWLRH